MEEGPPTRSRHWGIAGLPQSGRQEVQNGAAPPHRAAGRSAPYRASLWHPSPPARPCRLPTLEAGSTARSARGPRLSFADRTAKPRPMYLLLIKICTAAPDPSRLHVRHWTPNISFANLQLCPGFISKCAALRATRGKQNSKAFRFPALWPSGVRNSENSKSEGKETAELFTAALSEVKYINTSQNTCRIVCRAIVRLNTGKGDVKHKLTQIHPISQALEGGQRAAAAERDQRLPGATSLCSAALSTIKMLSCSKTELLPGSYEAGSVTVNYQQIKCAFQTFPGGCRQVDAEKPSAASPLSPR